MDFPGCRLVAERQFHHGETIENTLQKPYVRIQILRLYALKPEKCPFHELRSKRLGIRIPPRAPETPPVLVVFVFKGGNGDLDLKWQKPCPRSGKDGLGVMNVMFYSRYNLGVHKIDPARKRDQHDDKVTG